MRGHIGKKEYKNGPKYYIVVDLPDPATGKRKRKWLSGEDGKGFDRKKDAERAMPTVLKNLQEGTFVEPSKDTFGEVMAEWLKDKQSSVKHGTWKSYAWLVNTHLIPNLGALPISKLQPDHLHNLYHKILLPKLAVTSIKKLHVLILDALNRATTWGKIPRNIATVVELPQGKRTKFEVWNEEQLDTFLKAARLDQYYLVYHIAANTGMRQSEILGLRWVDVDFQTRTISVRQALTLALHGHGIDDTKNLTSVRSIALFPETVELLRQHRIQQTEKKWDNNRLYKDHGMVFQSSTGNMVNPRNMMRNYYNLFKLMNALNEKKQEKKEPFVAVPYIRFHDLRHTHATILLKNGVHPKIVQERLGHSSITVTLDTYSHVLPNLQEAVLKGIGDSITGKKNENINSL